MRGCSSGRYCNGIIGVPITFLDKHNPAEFAIAALTDDELRQFKTSIPGMIKNAEGKINGKPTYARMLIRRIA